MEILSQWFQFSHLFRSIILFISTRGVMVESWCYYLWFLEPRRLRRLWIKFFATVNNGGIVSFYICDKGQLK